MFVTLPIYTKFGTYIYLHSTVYAWCIYGLCLSRPCTAVEASTYSAFIKTTGFRHLNGRSNLNSI